MTGSAPRQPAVLSAPVALVTPWFGQDTRGGAENQAFQLVRALRALGADIEVWTTTSRDAFSPRTDRHYPPGLNEIDGVRIRRWAMDAPVLGLPPGIGKLARATGQRLPAFPAHEINLLGSLPNSAGLYQHLIAHPERRCVFIPYPMGLSFWGSFLAQGRAFHIPCLHDEPYAYYSTYRAMLRRANAVLFNTAPERAFALEQYELDETRAVVAGEGIDLHWDGDAERFRQRTGISGPTLLYVGRRDTGKNLPLLLSYFREWRARTGRQLTLLLAGPGDLPIPRGLGDWVVDLGFLDSQAKHDAYAAATVFCQPSTIESFSIVLMESWLQGTPALVNARCPVTTDFAYRSGAGLPFADFADWAGALERLLDDHALRAAMGAAGQRFVRRECRWDEVAWRTITAIATAEALVGVG